MSTLAKANSFAFIGFGDAALTVSTEKVAIFVPPEPFALIPLIVPVVPERSE